MAQTIYISFPGEFRNGLPLNAQTLNRYFRGISLLLSGTIGHADIDAGAIQADLVKADAYFYSAGTLTAGVYAVTLSPAPSGYITGMQILFKTSAINVGAVDVNVNSFGAKNLFKQDGTEFAASELPSGSMVLASYDGTDFRVLSTISVQNFAVPGTLAVTGATTLTSTLTVGAAVTLKGSAPNYAAGTLATGVYSFTLAPAIAAYATGMQVRFKADLVNAGAVDINVNALGAKNLFKPDGTEFAAGDIRAGQFVEAMYDGTNFLATSWQLPRTFTGTAVAVPTAAPFYVDFTHGLGAVPFLWKAVLVCTSTDNGYAVDDEIDVAVAVDNTGNPYVGSFTAIADATKVRVVRQNAAGVGVAFSCLSKDGTTVAALTASKWKINLRATA